MTTATEEESLKLSFVLRRCVEGHKQIWFSTTHARRANAAGSTRAVDMMREVASAYADPQTAPQNDIGGSLREQSVGIKGRLGRTFTMGGRQKTSQTLTPAAYVVPKTVAHPLHRVGSLEQPSEDPHGSRVRRARGSLVDLSGPLSRLRGISRSSVGVGGSICEEPRVGILPRGARLIHEKRGKGSLMDVNFEDYRDKPYIVTFDTGDTHHYTADSLCKMRLLDAEGNEHSIVPPDRPSATTTRGVHDPTAGRAQPDGSTRASVQFEAGLELNTAESLAAAVEPASDEATAGMSVAEVPEVPTGASLVDDGIVPGGSGAPCSSVRESGSVDSGLDSANAAAPALARLEPPHSRAEDEDPQLSQLVTLTSWFSSPGVIELTLSTESPQLSFAQYGEQVCRGQLQADLPQGPVPQIIRS